MTRHQKTKLALGFLELATRYEGPQAIDHEAAAQRAASAPACASHGSPALYLSLVDFRGCFDTRQWRGLDLLHRQDVSIPPGLARSIGIALRPAWRRVAPRADRFEAVIDRYYRMRG